MVKRKAECELVRFVWKRNKEFDVELLSAVELKNPFSIKNATSIWMEIAEDLQSGPLKMKVTGRSCRERVMDLLYVHRQNERQVKATSGVDEHEPTEVENLLRSVAMLQEAGQDEEVDMVSARKVKSEADTTAIGSDDTTNDLLDITDNRNESVCEASGSNAIDSSSPSGTNSNGSIATGPMISIRAIARSESSADASVREGIVRYLEKKLESDLEVRKDELTIKIKELDIKIIEANNRGKELDIEMIKARGNSDNQKRITDILTILANDMVKRSSSQ